jgi:uncharacterized protein
MTRPGHRFHACSVLALLFALLITVLGLTLPSPGSAQIAVPALGGRVNDLAGVLSREQRSALEQRLEAIERRRGAQVVVLTVQTTRPESIEQFAIRVAEAWKIGRGRVDGRKVDDGVLLVVAASDRTLRIEVGYGLEGAIPDALARRIIDEILVPRFRAGEVAAGLEAAVDAIDRLIAGEALPPPARTKQSSAQDWSAPLVVAFVVGAFASAVLGRLPGSALGGAAAGGVALLGGASVIGSAGFAALAFLLLLFLRPGLGGGRNGAVWTGGGGGWRGGSGGGFSGGGGGFGGGGASGRW